MKKEWWDVDPTDWKAMWQKTIGLDAEDAEETRRNEEVIFEGIPDGYACLEIGSGVGRLLPVASKHFTFAVGVDISETIVQMSKEYLRGFRCRVALSDGHILPFPDHYFDFVFSLVAFHHMPTEEMVRSNIKEAFRVLVPGGFFRVQTILQVNDGYKFASADDFWYEFERVGFVKEKIETGRSHPSHLWVTARKP